MPIFGVKNCLVLLPELYCSYTKSTAKGLLHSIGNLHWILSTLEIG